MIPFLPTLYPDELMYSLFARYYIRSGYINYVSAAEELFGDKRVHPDPELIPVLSEKTKEWLSQQISFEEMIMEHTVFKYYARYVSAESRKEALDYLKTGKKGVHKILRMAVDKSAEKRMYLRYCPICVKEDRIAYGEAYWHVSCQLSGIDLCVKHHCRLKESSILLRDYGSPNLAAAELEIPEVMEQEIEEADSKEIQFTDYAWNVFQQPLRMDQNIMTAEFLRSRLYGSRFCSPRGGLIYKQLLYEEYTRYIGFDSITMSQMRRLFETKKPVTHMDVCRMAQFLHIKPDEFAQMRTQEGKDPIAVDEQIQKMHKAEGKTYRQIAAELNVPLDTVKAIGSGRYRSYNKAADDPGKGRGFILKQRKDWNLLDSKNLSLVKEIIQRRLGNAGERPKRITSGAIAKELGVHAQSMYKLKNC